jgi:hypothetical protein
MAHLLDKIGELKAYCDKKEKGYESHGGATICY